MNFNQMGIQKYNNPYPNRISNNGRTTYNLVHQSSPFGVISSTQVPIVITYRADSTKTVTRNGYFNGQTKAFTVTRSASKTSRTSAYRAKQKADSAAYESAKNEAYKRAKSWENKMKSRQTPTATIRITAQPQTIFRNQPQPQTIFRNQQSSSLYLTSSGKVFDQNGIPVYGTGLNGFRFP